MTMADGPRAQISREGEERAGVIPRNCQQLLDETAGVKSFVFASSCSVYGYAEDGARNEKSPLDPLSAYARSKVNAERDLAPLADSNFEISCLRFATACGMSDLVLNDFVASAVATKRITVLSDGTPWRPLIDVHDRNMI